MTLFNSYYPPEEHNYNVSDGLTDFYRNNKDIADCVCEDVEFDISKGNDIQVCVPSLVILLNQMHREILSLKEQVEYLKSPD